PAKPGRAGPARQHAEELRRRNCFAHVREAFWKQEPLVKTLHTTLDTPRVFIVPLFISEGYFSEEVIPRELGFSAGGQGRPCRIQHHSGQTIFYCKPVGTHDDMTELLLGRAQEVVEKFPFPRAPRPEEISLFVSGPGPNH